jgi:antitoxin (DNA-binding transcriptional repressor) of toxin-antitoxin stability system
MKKLTISVTEAARNFAECVNRAHYQNITYVLLRNGEPVARLAPDAPKSCVGRELAEALEAVVLPVKEAAAWSRELRRSRRTLKAPANRWR